MTWNLAALTLVPVLLAPGGVRDRVEILERDVGSLKEDVLELRQGQTQILLELEKLNQRLGVDQEQGLTDVAVRIEQVDDDVRVLFENLNDIEGRLRRMEDRVDLAVRNAVQAGGRPPVAGPVRPGDAMASDGTAPTTPPMEEGAEPMEGGDPVAAAGEPRNGPLGEAALGETPPATGSEVGAAGGQAGVDPTLEVDPEELYQTAYTDFARGNYELAILGFQDYVRRFPKTDLADNAMYWIGESQYSLGRYNRAVQSFQDVATLYPGGEKVPDALLKKGYALIELNRMDQGIRELQGLIAEHPRSNAARIARSRLRAMGLPSP